MELSVADTLERAADLLWVRGRCKGTGERDDGSLCVVGAFLAARGCSDPARWAGRVETWDVRQAFDGYLAEHPDLIPSHLMTDEARALLQTTGRFPSFAWNDGVRDDDLVIDTLRRCAKELRAVEP